MSSTLTQKLVEADLEIVKLRQEVRALKSKVDYTEKAYKDLWARSRHSIELVMRYEEAYGKK